VRLPADKHVVRGTAFAVVTLSAALPAAMTVPARLPSVATGSVLLLYAERALVIFAALVLVLVFLYRGWHGQLPRSVSREGAEWDELSSTARGGDEGVQEQLDALLRRLLRLEAAVEMLLRSTSSTMEP
jgi:hypothetical protein